MNGSEEADAAPQKTPSKPMVDPRDVPIRVDTLSDSDDTEATGASSSLNALPQKKKKKRSKKKKKTATGFEEGYAEPPLTRVQAEEEEELYDPEVSFEERIEVATARFRTKRRWSPLRQRVFDTYLSLGGIHSGANNFTGTPAVNSDDDDIDTRPKDEAPKGRDLGEVDVDFTWVARAFLGWKVRYDLGIFIQDEMKECANVVWNYLKYIQFHRVCPEYAKDVENAIRIAESAKTEMVKNQTLSMLFPGKLNISLSTCFGGLYYIPEGTKSTPDWAKDVALSGYLSLDEARSTVVEHFGSGILSTKVNKEGFASTEVVSILEPVEGSKTQVGTVNLITWTAEGADPAPSMFDDKRIQLHVERSLLDNMYVGMHLELSLKELDIGIIYFDMVNAVNPSFYLEYEDSDTNSWH